LRFILTAGQANDAKEAERLLEGLRTGHVMVVSVNFCKLMAV
jgi:hypothetical protein